MFRVLLILLLFLPICAFSSMFNDANIELEEVVVSGKTNKMIGTKKKFSVGTIEIKSDSTQLTGLETGSLVDYLTTYTSLNIKENGNGMLATISQRGLSSSHTAFLWNGMNINSYTMGQTDLSLLPLFFFDEVVVNTGGEGALYGDGSLGGSVVLNNKPRQRKGLFGNVNLSYGSFNTIFSGVKLGYSGDKFYSRTSVYLNGSKNDFPFANITLPRKPVENQNNASYYSVGGLQEFGYKMSNRDELSLNMWANHNTRGIQPSMGNNNDPKRYDTLRTTTVRSVLSYNRSGKTKINANFNYAYDRQIYQDNLIAINSFGISAEAERTFSFYTLRIGANLTYLSPESGSYHENANEFRGDVYALSRFAILRNLAATLNLRQTLVTNVSVPFTPSVGMSYSPIDNFNHIFTIRGNSSINTKVPTLNDRYWGDMNNNYLLPEKGYGGEGGVNYRYMKTSNNFNIDLFQGFNIYSTMVYNWIVWLPYGNIWKPRNMELVGSSGVEAFAHQFIRYKDVSVKIVENYSYTDVSIIEGFVKGDAFSGTQMPYQPLHKLSLSAEVGYKGAAVTLSTNYNGTRRTNDIFVLLDDYWLTNLRLSYTYKINKHNLTGEFHIKNLFDIKYQNMPQYAMPGISFLGTIKWGF